MLCMTTLGVQLKPPVYETSNIQTTQFRLPNLGSYTLSWHIFWQSSSHTHLQRALPPQVTPDHTPPIPITRLATVTAINLHPTLPHHAGTSTLSKNQPQPKQLASQQLRLVTDLLIQPHLSFITSPRIHRIIIIIRVIRTIILLILPSSNARTEHGPQYSAVYAPRVALVGRGAALSGVSAARD